MTNAIAQFNIQFDATEDRLQLRVLSTDDAEVRIWLTRRYVRLLLKVLQEHVGTQGQQSVATWGEVPNSGFNSGSSSVTGQNATQLTDNKAPGSLFSDEYLATEETSLPLGEEPTLVTRIACREQDSSHLLLVLSQEQVGGVQVEINLSDELVNNLIQMLLEAASAAEWDLAGAKPAGIDFSMSMPGTVLH